MRLVKAEISGFGRLATGKINLDNKVIAVVGPNEAGKTTLLKALAYIDNGASLSVSERSRGMNVQDDHVVARVQYILDDRDLQSLVAHDLEEAPQSIWLSRTASGASEPSVMVEPAPRKGSAPLVAAVASLRKVATKRTFGTLEEVTPENGDGSESSEVEEGRLTLREDTERCVRGFLDEAVSETPVIAAAAYASDLRATYESLVQHDLAPDLTTALREVLGWIDRPDPRKAVGRALYEVTPNIGFFGEQDRALSSTYVLSDELIADVPAALSNLAAMAELDLSLLWGSIVSGDEGERETLIDAANQVLVHKFAEAWKQSVIAVWLKTEGTTLAVRIKQDGKRITQFSERSAGLRMFVALVAFLAVRADVRAPILLIDEAETHLHLDAQADLVNTFMTQDQAAKIIYTTHSPACLPPDLGSNIRAVVPDPSNESRSLLQSSFWQGAAGFSPLMLAMGAGAAAFSTARFVVLAEGASEMLMLPSLIKAAVELPDLIYQVAPGLSEVPTEMYPELDLVGARVAYLLDSDQGGLDRRTALLAGGVPEERIILLGALTLENLLDQDLYLKVVRGLLLECNSGVAVPKLPELSDPALGVWPNELEKWARRHSLKMPGKRVIASRLVEDGGARPSSYGAPILMALHQEIENRLGIDRSRVRS